MAFNPQEQNIINYGLQNGKSKEDVTKALSNFRAGITTQSPQNKNQNVSSYPADAQNSIKQGLQNGTVRFEPSDTGGEYISSADKSFGAQQHGPLNSLQPAIETLGGPLKSAVDKTASGIGDVAGAVKNVVTGKASDENTRNSISGALKTTSGIAEIAGSPISTLLNVVGKIPMPGGKNLGDYAQMPIQKIGDLIGNDPKLQKIVTDNPHLVEDIPNALNTIALLVALKGPTETENTNSNDFETKLHEQNAQVAQQIENSKVLGMGDKTMTQDQMGQIHSEEQAISNYKNTPVQQVNSEVKTNTPIINEKLPTSAENNAGTIKNVTRDIIPTRERIVNSETTRALNLTQGDVKNINLSTGNEVGQFLADKNLIGDNLESTTKNIKDFGDTNYTQVRNEIGKVTSKYPANTVPRYAEALRAIKQQIQDVAGLQDVNKEVDSLLSNKKPTLNDIQRVKELMDDHFDLYNVVGDVKSGVQKQGIAQIRSDLRSFIEQQVKIKTGADIRELNNNVSTAKSIEKAIETRSTRGLTKSMISPTDIGTFVAGTVTGGPGIGLLAVIAKKVYESPTIKLKFSKWLDGLNDAQKIRAQTDLQKGLVPKNMPTEIKSIIKK